MAQPSEWVEGQFLVLKDWTALPLRCVRTNRPVGESEYTSWNLPWLSPELKLWMCIAPGVLLFAPHIVRNRCHVQAGISRQVRLKYLLRKLLAFTLILGSLLVPALLVAFRQFDTALATIYVFPFLCWGGFVLLILFTSPLTIHHHGGEHFWLDGCSPEFLASVKASLDEPVPT